MAVTTPGSMQSSVLNPEKVALSDGEVKHIKEKFRMRNPRQEEIFIGVSFIFLIHALCSIRWGKLVAACVLYLLTGVFGIGLACRSNIAHKSFKLQQYQGNPAPSPAFSTKWAWRDIIYASVIFFVHFLCLFAPSTFSWRTLITTYILYLLLAVLGLTLSYHRNLAHQSFKLPKYLEYLFAYFGLLAFQGDPIFWVSTHRYHHKVTDTERDPHSPIQGLMFSHVGWIFDVNKMAQKGVNYNNVQDLKSQAFYVFLQRTVALHMYGFAMILYVTGGFPYIVWGIGVRTVWSYHTTFTVNSVCHIWGHQSWNTGDLSKNNWCLSLITFGESWHNNHHAFQYSARHGLDRWQIDLTWFVIKMLEYLGLATDVKLPSEKHMQRMSFNKESDD